MKFSRRCLHTAYLRLTAKQFIFRLLGVSEERILDHAKHVASAQVTSPLSAPLGCCLYSPFVSLVANTDSSRIWSSKLLENPWETRCNLQQYPDAPKRKISSRDECAFCSRDLSSTDVFFFSSSPFSPLFSLRRHKLEMLTSRLFAEPRTEQISLHSWLLECLRPPLFLRSKFFLLPAWCLLTSHHHLSPIDV